MVQFLASNFVSPQLADIGAALAGAAALVAVAETRRAVSAEVRARVLTGTRTATLDRPDERGEVVRAYLPYALIIVVFSLAQVPPVKNLLDRADLEVPLGRPRRAQPNGKAVSGNTFSLPFLNTGGTLVLLAGIIR